MTEDDELFCFLKQKTANGVRSGLGGSEVGIRDSL